MSNFVTDVILGVAFHYCIVSATLWWFFHVSVIFYKLVWPLKAMQTVKYEKYIHLFLVVLGKQYCMVLENIFWQELLDYLYKPIM